MGGRELGPGIASCRCLKTCPQLMANTEARKYLFGKAVLYVSSAEEEGREG